MVSFHKTSIGVSSSSRILKGVDEFRVKAQEVAFKAFYLRDRHNEAAAKIDGDR